MSDATLAYVAAISYASYFCITIVGIYLSTRLAPRLSVLLGGLAAVIGMATIAAAQSPFMLTAGVAIAGVSPGLAYTPFSEIIATLVSEARQRAIYSIINSGTSLGVMLSGPAAILLGEKWRLAWASFAAFGLLSTLWCVAILPRLPARDEPLSFAGVSLRTLTSIPAQALGVMLSGPAAILLGEKWRLAWASFAVFGLLSTLWCVAILPRLPARDEPLSFAGVSLRTLTEGARARLFLVSFLIGIATSIYWAFSVDLVTAGANGTYELLGFKGGRRAIWPALPGQSLGLLVLPAWRLAPSSSGLASCLQCVCSSSELPLRQR